VSTEITWLSIFGDVPAARFSYALAFWEQITNSAAGAAAGESGEFTPLEPRDGDRFLWLQRVGRDDGGWHPDLHVPDLAGAVDRAVELGGRIVRDSPDLIVLETPGGQPFCLARDDRPRARCRPEPPQWPSGRSLTDQLCLDIPADRYDRETEFWTALTGWRTARSDAPEFRRLDPPGTLPVQFLLQRLGAEDIAGPRAHVDLSADNRDAEVARHESLGATVRQVCEGWTTLHDPAGLIYCVTRRPPGHPPR
jgi:predicted enzyme related to lactoylglutathione lyase